MLRVCYCFCHHKDLFIFRQILKWKCIFEVCSDIWTIFCSYWNNDIFCIFLLTIIFFCLHPFLIIIWFLNEYSYGELIQYWSSCASSISMLKYKNFFKNLIIHLQSFILVLFIHWIFIFDHKEIKRQSFIFFIHFNMVSLLHMNWNWFN